MIRGIDGLSQQLVRSHLCAFPDAVAEFTPHPNITLTHGRVYPLATAQSVTAIRQAADRTPISINSAFRTVADQYMLYHGGGCGLAATPGNSNHQSGRAIDVQNWSAAQSALLAAGCIRPHPGTDDVHFDCPGADMRSASVLVFQRLWNANNPGDLIDEDGAYGPQTGNRLGRSPAAGFDTDLCDVIPRFGAGYVMQTFPVASADPIMMTPGEEMVGTIELENTGTADWNGSTWLATTEPRDRASVFAGPDWESPSRVDGVEGTVPPGETWAFTFTLKAPIEPGEYREFFGMVQEGEAWFSDSGHLGPPDDQLQIRVLVVDGPGPHMPDGGLADGGVPVGDAALPGYDGGIDTIVGGGCACSVTPGEGAGHPLGLAGLVLLGAVIAWRRRR